MVLVKDYVHDLHVRAGTPKSKLAQMRTMAKKIQKPDVNFFKESEESAKEASWLHNKQRLWNRPVFENNPWILGPLSLLVLLVVCFF